MDNKHIADFYDQFVEQQESTGINERHLSILKKSIEMGLKKSDEVLEVGCGIGTFTKLLSGHVTNGNILAVDISEKSIELARKNFSGRTNVTFEVLNLTSETLDKKFDTIILPDVLEHIPLEEHQVLFKNLSTLLTEQGNIFIHIPNPYYLEWCITHRPEVLQVIDQPIFTNELAQNLYKNDLHIHSLKTYPIWVKDGDYQFIVVKKNGFQDFSQNRKQPLLMAVYLKIRKLLKLDF